MQALALQVAAIAQPPCGAGTTGAPEQTQPVAALANDTLSTIELQQMMRLRCWAWVVAARTVNAADADNCAAIAAVLPLTLLDVAEGTPLPLSECPRVATSFIDLAISLSTKFVAGDSPETARLLCQAHDASYGPPAQAVCAAAALRSTPTCARAAELLLQLLVAHHTAIGDDPAAVDAVVAGTREAMATRAPKRWESWSHPQLADHSRSSAAQETTIPGSNTVSNNAATVGVGAAVPIPSSFSLLEDSPWWIAAAARCVVTVARDPDTQRAHNTLLASLTSVAHPVSSAGGASAMAPGRALLFPCVVALEQLPTSGPTPSVAPEESLTTHGTLANVSVSGDAPTASGAAPFGSGGGRRAAANDTGAPDTGASVVMSGPTPTALSPPVSPEPAVRRLSFASALDNSRITVIGNAELRQSQPSPTAVVPLLQGTQASLDDDSAWGLLSAQLDAAADGARAYATVAVADTDADADAGVTPNAVWGAVILSPDGGSARGFQSPRARALAPATSVSPSASIFDISVPLSEVFRGSARGHSGQPDADRVEDAAPPAE